MDNYSKILTFFMENNVQLTTEQLEALKEEFLEEKAVTGAMRKLLNNRVDEYNKLVNKGNKNKEIDTPKRNAEAEELYKKADEIATKDIVPNKNFRNSEGYRHIPDTNDALWYRDNAPKKDDPNVRYNAHAIKSVLGQGKENMPKDREPGTYLKKQELINKYEKGEK